MGESTCVRRPFRLMSIEAASWTAAVTRNFRLGCTKVNGRLGNPLCRLLLLIGQRHWETKQISVRESTTDGGARCLLAPRTARLKTCRPARFASVHRLTTPGIHCRLLCLMITCCKPGKACNAAINSPTYVKPFNSEPWH